MDLWILGAVLAAGISLLSSFRLLNRPRYCPECHRPTEATSRDHKGGFMPVVEIRFWCPRCARVVGRRYLTVAFD